MFKLIAVLIALQGLALAEPGSSIVTHHLERALHQNNVADIFVTLKEDTSKVLSNIANSRFASRSAKLNALHAALNNHARTTQEPITSFLSSQPQTFEVTSFWITNQLYIRNADSALVSQLENNFPHLIASIDEEFFAQIDQPVSIKLNVTVNQDDHQWGVKKIQAPEAWDHMKGTLRAGEGVVIATIDTGARGTHEALRDNFVGSHGWFDPSTSTPTATDNNGHGTHTTGTIAGGKGIGVAPAAKWAACRGCAGFFCSQSDLIRCGQFVTCPTHPDGSNADCSKAPDLVSNSWGGGRGATWFDDTIAAWHTAGIIPVFSIGNNGPSCNTANSPGDRNVIGVGSTTEDDEISYFSSVGPTIDERMKPDISAPGSDVVSAYNTADDAYASMSGTSMACPHTAGVVALLRTRNKNLNYEQAKRILNGNTDKDLAFSGQVCGNDNIGDDEFPNYVFGSGRLNALKSVRAQTDTL